MRLLRDTPIERKLTIIAMSASWLALLLACLAFVAYEMVVYRDSMVQTLSATADMLGTNSSAGLAFNDSAYAEQTLASLNAYPHVTGAIIYDADGDVFAEYQAAGNRHGFDPPAAEQAGHRFEDDRLRLFRPIRLAGERAGTVYVESDLDEMRARLGRYGVIVALVMVVASLAAYVLVGRLQAAISGPISHLASTMSAVAASQDYSLRAEGRGKDELGRLIDGFNAMLDRIQSQDHALREAHDNLERRVEERTRQLQAEVKEREQAQAELEKIHAKLLDASHQAGMAEIASNVLHNVGNVLNSVNVSTNLIAETLQRSKLPGLTKVAELLRENEQDLADFMTNDPRGRHVLTYLNELARHLSTEQAQTLKELESLRGNIEHIKEIVTMQQNYARLSGVATIVKVADLVEDSLEINARALNRHGVQVIRELDPELQVNVDKHKLLQILTNLVRNAKYACDESGRTDKQVTLRVAREGECVRISVSDNGIGIPTENLARIFNHGFTTRESGHGFGLHSAALAARELGGSLDVHSDGIGHGATFTVQLPLHAEREEAAYV